jgi:hypothetical protein
LDSGQWYLATGQDKKLAEIEWAKTDSPANVSDVATGPEIVEAIETAPESE